MIDRLKKWYRGTFIPWENDPDSGVIVCGGHYERPLLARALNVVFDFWLAHWQWIVTTILAILAIFFTLK